MPKLVLAMGMTRIVTNGWSLVRPSTDATSGGTRLPLAVLPPSSIVVRNLMPGWRQPPAMAPTTTNGSAPSATAAGSGASGGS